MDKTTLIVAQLNGLADRLSGREAMILDAWRRAVEADVRLTSVSAISRKQFYDHIPAVLAAFERALRAHGGLEEARAVARQKESAGEHGLVRWQQGFGLFEVMCEWHHLQLCLLDEFERDAANHPELDAAVMLFARRSLAELCGDGVCQSAEQYSRLQQTEAAGRVDDLEQALANLGDLERARSAIWREAAHDLRGNLGVVKNATELLNHPAIPEDTRVKSLAVLRDSVNSLHALLNDLTVLARLEAGHEPRNAEMFDAATMLLQLSSEYQSLAGERGLFLSADGPSSLMVEGDIVKARRIAQNLVLNALQYTERGGVRLSWDKESPGRWYLCVEDTGPGISHGTGVPLAQAIKEATVEAQGLARDAPAGQAQALPALSPPRTARPPGEGIGLSIVKRLCDLLDASIELRSEPGKGSSFRISIPRSYAA